MLVSSTTSKRPDPKASEYAGHDCELGLTVRFQTNRPHPQKTGWYYIYPRTGAKDGPFITSEAAYDAFHTYIGWVRMDKEPL